jgi:hypothetical protein
MRKSIWGLAVAGGLAVASHAGAQTTSSVNGINPRDITFTPIDTTKFLAAPVLNPTQGRFSLMNFIPQFSFPGFSTKPVVAISPLPPPSSFPSTQYKSAFVPMAPFTPGK